METDQNDFYAAGYFLIRAGHPGWEQLRGDSMPDKFVSLSDCICPMLEVTWGWTPGDRQAALDFGIPEDRMDAFLEWCRKDFKETLDYPGVFHSIDAAREFIGRFLPDTHDRYLVGAGLAQAQAGTIRTEPGRNATGIEQQLGRRMALEPGGETLGYEVASLFLGHFGHSWLCNLSPEDVNRQFGIRVNGYGLIDSFARASALYAWIAEDEMKGTRAEPEPYFVWVLVSYPLESGARSAE